MQTLRAGCSKAEPKIFHPLQTPVPGAQDGQNLISWRWSLSLLAKDASVLECTWTLSALEALHNALYKFMTYLLYLQTQFGEDRITQFRVIVVTDP